RSHLGHAALELAALARRLAEGLPLEVPDGAVDPQLGRAVEAPHQPAAGVADLDRHLGLVLLRFGALLFLFLLLFVLLARVLEARSAEGVGDERAVGAVLTLVLAGAAAAGAGAGGDGVLLGRGDGEEV